MPCPFGSLCLNSTLNEEGDKCKFTGREFAATKPPRIIYDTHPFSAAYFCNGTFSSNRTVCPGTNAIMPCMSGHYCPTPAHDLVCPKGHYCPEGSWQVSGNEVDS